MKIWCPRCDQGWVTRFRVRGREQVLQVCDECDAAWPEGRAIGATNFEDMSTYLEGLGLKGEWRELEAAPDEPGPAES